MGWFSRNTDSKKAASEPPPPAPRTARMRDGLTGEDVAVPEANPFRSTLRVQIMGNAYVAATQLATDRVAMRRFGDAWLVVMRDHGAGSSTVQRDDLAKDGIGLDAAFLLGRKLGVQDTAKHVNEMTLAAAPGASTTVLVANSFYLSAVALQARADLGDAPMVVCPISWHHWVVAELAPSATRATLAALADLVGSIAGKAQVTAAETIGTSLWWWPVATREPVPFTPRGALPRELETALAKI